VDLVVDKLVCSAEELSGEKNDRGGAVTDLLVLLGSKRDEDTSLEDVSYKAVQDLADIQQGARRRAARG
jgi:hypothetical protein